MVVSSIFNKRLGLVGRLVVAAFLAVAGGANVSAQTASTLPSPSADCTVSALNRTAPLQGDYSFTLYNLPGAAGVVGPAALLPPPPPAPFRVRVSCSDGTVGETDLAFPEFGSTVVYTGDIYWRQPTPIPLGLSLSAAASRLSTGQSTQLTATAILPNATTADLSRRDKGTLFTSSNPELAAVSENGQVSVSALFASGSSSRVVMSAQNEGIQATTVLQLGPRGTLSGHVYRADGTTPVANAQVTVLRNQPREVVGTVNTDASGAFSLADVNAGQFSLSVIDPASGDMGRGNTSLQTDGESVQADIRLNGQGTVTVKVTDGAGAAVANAQVTLTSLSTFRDVRTLATDGAGVAVFNGALAGLLAVSTQDNVTGLLGTASAQLVANSAIIVPIRLQPVASLQGKVYGSDGATVQSGIQVRLLSQMRGIISQAVTGEDGAFRFSPLPLADGPYTLDAMQDGRLKARVPGIVPNAGGQILTQNIQFAPAGMVRGVVRLADGGAAVNATVNVQSLVGQRFSFSTKTDSQGAYAVDGVPVGAFSITASGTAGETGTGAGNLSQDAEVVTVDLQLASNGLVGTVFQRDGVTAVGAGVSVTLNPGNRTTQTNSAGQFGFTLTQANSYTIDAADGQGNRGRTSLVITTIDPQNPTSIKVVFLAKGTVSGTVRDAAGTLQTGVGVTLNSSSVFGGSQTATTDGQGQYTFANVFAGEFTVSARNTSTQLAGFATARITEEGQSVPVDVTLSATGSVSGRVFLRDGVTPVVGAQVKLQPNGSSSAVATVSTDANGAYSFPAVPIGEFTVDATEPSTGDRGRASSRVTTVGENRVLNLQLLGQGSVVVTTRNAQGLGVDGVVVTLNSNSLFGGNFNAVTDAQGRATFARVFNGDFSLSALKGAGVTRLSGTAQGTVANNAQVSVDVSLSAKPVGRVQGIVTKGLAATPTAGVTVQLRRVDGNTLSQQVVTGADGTFGFNAVEGETNWRLVARVNDRVRAQVDGVQINTDGETVSRDLTLLGVGKVTGRTLNTSGATLAGMRVEVNNPDPIYGGRFTVTSLADGSYSLTDVPAGRFTIRANNNTNTLQAESSGTVRFDGDVSTVDLTLVDNAVSMPRTLYDANSNSFTVQGDGSLSGGTRNVFSSGSSMDVRASRLELVVNNVPVPFANGDGSVGRRLMDGQLLEVDEANLASGLQVTRRTYVPKDGYFARHLEVLENRGSAPVTVGVRITSNFTQGELNNRVVDSSDGDAVITAGNPTNNDRWVVMDDERDADPFDVNSTPATSVVFDGVGAPVQVGAASVQTVGSTAKLAYEWSNVTVQPGQSVAFMHFTAQQLGRIPARYAAERLAQLPSEALRGLTVEEIAIIRNFNVPSDGLSQVAELAAVTGTTVSGQVLSGDGRTSIGGASVELRGLHPIFARRFTTTADANGRYAFASNNLGGSGAVAIAQDRVSLVATHPRTSETSAASNVPFVSGNVALAQDLIFVGTGNLRGVVKRHTATLVNSGRVYFDYRRPSGSTTTLQSSIAADGSYAFTGITPGDYTVYAEQPHPQGKAVVLATPVTVAVPAAETTVQELVLQTTGTVTGVLYNAAAAPVSGASVVLDPDPYYGNYRATTTDTGGRYRFDDVSVGGHAVSASGPNGLTASGSVSVTQDTSSVLDLTLGGLGTARVQVLYQRGVSAPSTYTYTSGSNGYTNGAGVISLTLRVGDNYTIRARHPDNSNLEGSTTVMLTANGEVRDVTVTLPAAASVSGTIYRANSTLAANVPVTLRTSPGLSYVSGGTTDSAGRFNFRGLALGNYILVSDDKTSLTYAEAAVQLTADGQEQATNLTLQNNRVSLPSSLLDANDFLYHFQADGGFRAYRYSTSYSDNFNTGSQLEINGQLFTGDTSASLEANRRQLVITQGQPLAGLRVTRKMFVPQGAYFARYLEVMENPTAEAITVAVKVKHRMISSATQIVDTSTGDLTLSTAAGAADSWFAVDDATDADPFQTTSTSYAAAATVFSDERAVLPPSQLTFTPYAGSGTSPNSVVGWSTITVPANGRVSLMHFDLRQISRASARHAAERLRQLPPEALQFLTPEEQSSVINFAMPENGQSQMAPLPSLLGRVSGRLFEGDGTTPVVNAAVNVKSAHPLFGRTWTYYGACLQNTESSLYTSATGAYSLVGRIADTRSIPLPVDSTVEVKSARLTCDQNYGYQGHPVTRIQSPVVTSSFTGSEAQANLVFQSGILTGTVIGPADYGASSGRVEVTVNSTSVSRTLSSNGTYTIPGMPPGTYTLNATVYHNQGTDLVGSRNDAVVTLGQYTVTDITIQQTGSVFGTVVTPAGEPVANADVDIASTSGPSISRYTWTDSLGRYSLSAVPVGTYSVTITDPRTDARSTSTVTVTQDQVTTHNVSVIGTGSLQLQVNYARGVAAANANVYLTSPSVGSERLAGRTDNLGRLTVLIPVGTYSLRAVHPNYSSVKTVVSGTMGAHNEAGTLAMALPALASVQLTVLNADQGNVPESGAAVYLTDTLRTNSNVGTTGGNGQFLLSNIPAGSYAINVRTTAGLSASVVGTVTVAEDGQVIARTASVTTVNDVLSVISYNEERELYSVQLAEGDHLDVRINGLQVGSVAPLYLARAQVYNPSNVQVARGYGYGPSGYEQYNEFNNLRDVVAPAAGKYTIAVSSYYSGSTYVGGVRLHLEVNGVPVLPQSDVATILTGRVATVGGSPVAGQKLRVRAYGGPGMNVETVTDAAGYYRVTGVPAGSVEIRTVATNGTVSGVVASRVIDAGVNDAVLDVAVPVSMTINIQVLDGNGSPIASAPVVITPPGSWVYTNASGQASYTYVGSSNVIVRASHPSDSIVTAEQTLPPQDGAVNVTLTLASASVSGTVRNAAGEPVSGAYVEVTRASGHGYLTGTYTDSEGRYAFAVLPAGVDLEVSSRDWSATYVSVIRNVSLTAGQTATGIDIAYPGVGTVQGRVTVGGSVPRVGQRVTASYVADARSNSREYRNAYAESDGTYVFSGALPVGMPIDLETTYETFADQNNRTLTKVVQLSSSGGSATADFDVSDLPGGSVLLKTQAADGGVLTADWCSYRVTSGEAQMIVWDRRCDTSYPVLGVPAGAVTVSLLQGEGPSWLQGQTSATVVNGQPVEAIIPISVLSGRVLHADGVAVQSPSIFTTLQDGSTFYPSVETDDQGNYRVLGLPVGEATIEVQDTFDSGLRQSKIVNMVSVLQPVVADITLPPGGTVQGIVRDSNGQPLAEADVYLRSSGLDYDRYVVSDADGRYVFTRVAIGTVSVFSKHPQTGMTGTATQELASGGQTISLNVDLPAGTEVSGTVRLGDGSGLAGATVTVRNAASVGPFGPFSAVTTTDASGFYRFANVQRGSVEVSARGAGGLVGAVTGTVEGVGVQMDVTITGMQLALPAELNGTDTSRYDVDCRGGLNDGGFGSAGDAYDGSYYLQVNNVSYPCVTTAEARIGAREFKLPVSTLSGLKVQRQVHVPLEGGYARYLETFVNESADQIVVPVKITGNLGSDGSTQLIVAPSSTSNLYAVTADFGSDPALAHVFGGLGPVTLPQWTLSGDNMSYQWTVTVPAGGKVSVLHFAVQTAPGDTTAAQAKAAALSNGTDPTMFNGLDAETRRSVINFVVPQ